MSTLRGSHKRLGPGASHLLLLQGKKKEIEPKERLSCSISCLQIAYNHQLDISVTAQTLKPFRFAWLLVCLFFLYILYLEKLGYYLSPFISYSVVS